MLSPWEVDELPSPPSTKGFRNWKNVLGPGLLLAGASVAAGEWLFGPAVTAQFGGTLMWLATVSILCQVFVNLEVMRYALYCGEPIFVGIFRLWPGPWFWTLFYMAMALPGLWPFMAQNAAVPLAAAVMGHLPGDAMTTLLGISMSESQLVMVMGYCIFIGSFIPLIFGRTVYRMLERIMTVKIVIVLGYLTLVALFMVSGRNAWEVATGFLRFGVVPFRADTVITGPHFSVTERDGEVSYTVKGTMENDLLLVTEFSVSREGTVRTYKMGEVVPPDLQDPLKRTLETAKALTAVDRFFVQVRDADLTLTMQGPIAADGVWEPEQFVVEKADRVQSFHRVDAVPEPMASRFRALLANKGLETQNLVTYVWEHGHLPPLPWALLGAFFAIAGAGGVANLYMSNYARDKGWGMGSKVGAIPSAVGGGMITLSHVGKVFRVSEDSLGRWRGWIRHTTKDQVGVWMLTCFVGMALPCMVSLEFIRNASVAGDRVAAMTAEGIASRYPAHEPLLWSLTLLIGFLVLAPGAIFQNDGMPRQWTDILWFVSKRLRKLKGNQVKYVYYGILLVWFLWGLVAISLLDPLTVATLGAGFGNLVLGVSALLTLYVNRKFLPRELQPNWFRQLGLICCGLIFIAMSLFGLKFYYDVISGLLGA